LLDNIIPLLDNIFTKKVIVPVSEPSDWAAPLVVIRGANGKIRLCVDYTLTGRAIAHSGKRDVAEDEYIGTELAFSVYNVAIQGVNTIIDPADDAASSPHLQDTLIEELRTEAAADPQYADLIAVIETGFPTNRTHTSPHLRQYWSIR
jgi:hypothetical protein